MTKFSSKIFIITTAVVFLFLFIVLTIVSFLNNKNDKLVNPTAEIQSQQINPLPTSDQPKEIKYDASTDLIKELETINPEVLDSDFENLPQN